MATQCPECKVDLMDAKVSLQFTPVTSTEDPEDNSDIAGSDFLNRIFETQAYG